MERLDTPEKNWKFSSADVKERGFWDKYQEAYEDMIRNTSSEHAPWFVVPADKKWFTRAVVAAAVIDAIDSINPQYPKLDEKKLADLAAARAALMNE
jgi:polyphosphate kinase 2 (PPK2 family)